MKKTFVLKTSVGEYSANIDKETLFELLAKKDSGETISIPLGEGTSYLEGLEYSDNVFLTLFPDSQIFAVVEHNLSQKESIDLKTE